jgi:hypothetical protein
MSDGFAAHRRHQPQVPERSHSAQLAFAQQPFEVLVFVLPCGQGNLPSVGRFKRVLDELVPNGCQFGSFRFWRGPGQHIAELYLRASRWCFANLVGVKLRERPRFPSRKRLLVLSPVERHELTRFAGSLDYPLQRFRHE